MEDNSTSSNFITVFTSGDVIYISILSPLLLVIIIGNLICLQVLRLTDDLRPATKIFMTSLAVSDLLVGFCGLSHQFLFVAHEFNWTLAQSSVFCHLNAISTLYFTATESFSVLLLNFDAFVAIVKPLRYHLILTSRRATVITITVWLVLTIWTFANTLVDTMEPSLEYLPKFRMCFLIISLHSVPAQVLGLVHTVFINIGPAFTILIIYIKLYRVSKTHHRRLQFLGMNTDMTQRAHKHGKRKAEVSVILITIGYFIGWMPFTICFTVEFHFAIPIWATSVAVICFFINCSWNVFIYYWRLKPFRISAMKLLRIKS